MFRRSIFFTCFLLFALLLSAETNKLAIPAHKPDADIYTYPGYTLQYDEKFEQADWVAYEQTKTEVYGNVAKRTDKFREDPNIKTGSATDADYKKSGYDRGHLAPAADMKYSTDAMKDCFYYSNMSPQVPAFNRGIWSDLEAIVRYWATTNEAILIVTGPVLNKATYPTIGPDHVAVPEYFYKVILDYRLPELKGIAFVIPNKKTSAPIESYACTIDEAERITGLDFFPDLPDSEEVAIESRIDLSLWPMVRYTREN
jgi:DNA/RNA endonuclease G, NUC1